MTVAAGRMMSDNEKGHAKWQIMKVVSLDKQRRFCVCVQKATTEWFFSHAVTTGHWEEVQTNFGFLTFASGSKAILKVVLLARFCSVLCYAHTPTLTHTLSYLARHTNWVLPLPSSVPWSWAPVKYLWQRGYRTACPLNAGPCYTHSLQVGWGLGHLEGSDRCS